jgi:hypothetical protein
VRDFSVWTRALTMRKSPRWRNDPKHAIAMRAESRRCFMRSVVLLVISLICRRCSRDEDGPTARAPGLIRAGCAEERFSRNKSGSRVKKRERDAPAKAEPDPKTGEARALAALSSLVLISSPRVRPSARPDFRNRWIRLLFRYFRAEGLITVLFGRDRDMNQNGFIFWVTFSRQFWKTSAGERFRRVGRRRDNRIA